MALKFQTFGGYVSHTIVHAEHWCRISDEKPSQKNKCYSSYETVDIERILLIHPELVKNLDPEIWSRKNKPPGACFYTGKSKDGGIFFGKW